VVVSAFGRPTRTVAGASTARISASRADDSRRPHAPEIVPALVNRNRELIVELCLVVGPVEPDLGALDVAPSQYLVQIRETGTWRQSQPGTDVPYTIASRPSHVLTHVHDGTPTSCAHGGRERESAPVERTAPRRQRRRVHRPDDLLAAFSAPPG
jgi:hypothetical protein